MRAEDQFLVELRLAQHACQVVYTVRHCRPLGEHAFKVGAAFNGIISGPIDAKPDSVFAALLSPMRRKVKSPPAPTDIPVEGRPARCSSRSTPPRVKPSPVREGFTPFAALGPPYHRVPSTPPAYLRRENVGVAIGAYSGLRARGGQKHHSLRHQHHTSAKTTIRPAI